MIEGLNFRKAGNGLIPAIIQDASSGLVLMLGYMNEEALSKTIRERKVTFYSRSKKRLWTKGESSGNFLELVDIRSDCDKDTLLIKVMPKGPVCHSGDDSCFQEKNNPEYSFLGKLENIIMNRKENYLENSYTSSLFKAGINKIAQKFGEEAVELLIEAKDEHKEQFLNEAADLMFHYLVLLSAKSSSLKEVIGILDKRMK
jgi:phosphoribosyl-ATP pyrophosphohydrolase/phosphoribosyl-AMP cyclohydrolase